MIKKLVEQNEDSLTFTIENEESTNSIVKYLVDEIGFCIVDITKLADFDYLPDDIKQKMKSITKGLNVSYPELSVEVTPGFAFLSNFDKENWIRVNSYLSAPLEIKYIFGNTELMEIILDFIDIVKNKIDEQKIKRISREFPAVVIEGFEFYSE
jgi:hypothetical protein